MKEKLLAFLLGQKAGELREIQRLQLRNELGCPTWAMLFLSAALIAVSFWLYRKPNLKPFQRALLSLLRGLGFVIIFLIVARPYISLEGLLEVKGQLLIVLDGTESMTIQDVESNGKMISRFEAGKTAMKKLMARNEELSEHFYPSYYLYTDKDERLDPTKPELLDQRAASGQQTSFVQVVNQALRDHKGEPVSAFLFLTDGGHNTGEFWENTVEDLKAEKIPFFSMGLGRPEAHDISLSHIFSEDMVFINEAAPFLLKIQQTGYGGQEITVKLTVDGQEQGSKLFRLESGREQTFSFPYIPKVKGRHKFKFLVEPKPDEMVTRNNELERVVEVVDDQIRVLLYYGKPDWEYRYLKGALARDKRVKLTLLMDELDRRFLEQGDQKEYLRTFPEQKKDLVDKFDLLIIGQVHASTLSNAQLEMIRDYVGEEGGSIVFVADPTDIPGSYKNTALEPLFPMKFQAAKGRTLKEELTFSLRDEVYLQLSEEGKQHPLMRLEEDANLNERVWNSFLPHYWFYQGQGLKPSALSLLSERAGRARGEPLITHQAFGKGSVLFMGINDTWRWRYQVGETYFRRYWGKVVQFMGLPHLTGASALITLTTDKRAYLTGEQVNITARVLNPDFSPSTAEKVAVKVVAAGSGDAPTVELTPMPGRKGMYKGSYVARKEGEYTLSNGETASSKVTRGVVFQVR